MHENLATLLYGKPLLGLAILGEHVSTSIEIGIERLHSTRLHREANSVIDSTSPGDCTLMVERVERTLLVMDSYRGGMQFMFGLILLYLL